MAIANIVAYNMMDSIDAVVVNVLDGGSNVLYGTGGSTTPTATNEVAAEDTLAGADIRHAVTLLRSNKAVPRDGMLYACYMHPMVAHDLRAETGALAFEDIRKYTEPNVGNILQAVTGVYGGAYIVETPRALSAADGAGSPAETVYRTFIAGQQALAEATAVEPGVVIGPVVDKLMRFRPVGWYSIQGWSVYRQAALYRIESSSSL